MGTLLLLSRSNEQILYSLEKCENLSFAIFFSRSLTLLVTIALYAFMWLVASSNSSMWVFGCWKPRAWQNGSSLRLWVRAAWDNIGCNFSISSISFCKRVINLISDSPSICFILWKAYEFFIGFWALTNWVKSICLDSMNKMIISKGRRKNHLMNDFLLGLKSRMRNESYVLDVKSGGLH